MEVPDADLTNLTRAEWRRIGISGYGPTLVASIGFGAVIPLVALAARDLGATVGQAAFVTALLGIGQLIADLPAGTIAERLGEKWAIVLACLVDAVALSVMWWTDNLLVLGAAVTVQGMAGAIFALARQVYLTEAIPLRFRARALSSLGGVFRIGFLVGPLAGAWIIGRWSLSAAFAFAALTSVIAAVITLALPDLPERASPGVVRRRVGLLTVVRDHRRVLATLGVGVLAIMLVRTARQTILPLWCDAHGISPATTSLIFAVSMGFDVLLFLPGGVLIDHFGRWWGSVPSITAMGVGFLLLVFAHAPWSIVAVAAFLGVANGLSSGIVMTLGSDASPAEGRAQFLSVWRLFSDTGNAVGPLVITAITAFAPLATAVASLGFIALAGGGWLAHHVPGRPTRGRQ